MRLNNSRVGIYIEYSQDLQEKEYYLVVSEGDEQKHLIKLNPPVEFSTII